MTCHGRLLVKEGSVKRMSKYLLSINENNVIQIIKPDRTNYEVVYQKQIKTPKKDILEAYKTLLKLNGGK